MIAWKTSLLVLVVLGGLGGSAQAQQGNAPARGYPTYPGPGTNGDYYSITNGFGPYNLPGTYPKYQGYGLSGYGPGAIVNEYFVPWPAGGVKSVSAPMPAPSKSTGPKPKPQKGAGNSSRVAPPKPMTSRQPPGK
jgi:hypothetical protein